MRAREEKNTQESDDELWARLDNRIEWARARHELARLGIVWRSRPFTKRCAGERVWNHAIHRVVTRSSIPATRDIITVPQPYLLIGVCMLQSMHGGRAAVQ